MNKATNRIDKQKKSGLATNGFDKMRVRVVVGSGSCACRDGDQTERTMLGNDGIRLPVTAKLQQKFSRREEVGNVLLTILVLFSKKKAVPSNEMNVTKVIMIGKSMLLAQMSMRFNMCDGQEVKTHPKPTSSSPR
jgi:hypothetical protein